MTTVNPQVEQALGTIFGTDLRTDRVERMLYSRDVGELPSLVAPLVPTGLAGAVVRPRTEAQLIELVKLSRAQGVPLVPRGAGTSGYGGVLPKEGAIVADLTAMDAVLEVDAKALTVRVQAGIIWEVLQKKLVPYGLDLRVYPSSLPSSTAGGWLAQGGAGFGSHEFGVFSKSVVSARVVLPDATVRELRGEELQQLVADAEGITGFISELTVQLRKLEVERHRLYSFPDAAALSGFINGCSAQKLPLWSITFLNPQAVTQKARMPLRHGHPHEVNRPEDPKLPVSYLALLAWPASRDEAIVAPLEGLLKAGGGVDLGRELAEHEWSERFAPMRLKRIGPSLIPTEVMVPLNALGEVLGELGRVVKHTFVMEGMLVDGEQVVILGFIPHDQRTLAFNVAYAMSLTVLGVAKRHGGSAYSTGLFFRHEAKAVLGAPKAAALQRFKQQIDPGQLQNPAKVLGKGFLDLVMKSGAMFEPMVRPIANAARSSTGDLVRTAEENGVPASVGYYAYACAQCGYCVSTCEQYSARGFLSQSPRGKYLFLREVAEGREKFDQKMVDTFLLCTTCEVCNDRCQLHLPVEHSWMAMRGKLIDEEKRMTFPPFEMMAASLRGENDIWAFKKEHRADWVPEDMKPKLAEAGEVLYFGGCTASFVNTDVAEASVRLLTDAGVKLAYMGKDEACCGIPMKVAGKWDLFEEIYLHNTSEARKRGAKTIVTSCPACGLVWKELYRDLARKRNEPYEFEVKHYSELLTEALKDGRLTLDTPVKSGTVTFHDSCHLGRAQGVYEPPRELLAAMPGVKVVEMEHNRDEALCCGSVLTLVGEKPVAPVLGKARLDEALAAGADTLVAACPCCQVQLRDSAKKNDLPVKVTDLARFVAEAKGYHIEDKTDFSNYMWGFFDKFIDLMQPKAMAQVMKDIFPEMMDAMPFGMKPMMRLMKFIPGGLWLLGVMLPILFPLMAPGILGKVMPAMVAAVKKRVGVLPPDMDSLMPDLLPKTMDSLMPNYLPLLLPHLAPLFVEHLRST